MREVRPLGVGGAPPMRLPTWQLPEYMRDDVDPGKWLEKLFPSIELGTWFFYGSDWTYYGDWPRAEAERQLADYFARRQASAAL